MTLVQILLPLFDNAGLPFARDLHGAVRQELLERFGGLTAYTRSPATGLWAQDQDKVVRDDIAVYEVMADRLDLPWWKDYRGRLESRFAQETVVIRALAMELL